MGNFKTRILVVGQTPPPFGGQAIMIERLVRGKYEGVEIFHARMEFSSTMDEMGRFRLKKIWKLVTLIVTMLRFRFFHGTKILYYPPAGPSKLASEPRTALYRDFAILIATRPFFKKTIFHFHASGLSTLYDDLPSLHKFFFRRAYYYPDVAIRMSKLPPEDGKAIKARHEVIVPYGIMDVAETNGQLTHARPTAETLQILFVGVLCESKGVMVVLEACKQLRRRNIDFAVRFMGKFDSATFESRAKHYVEENGLGREVTWLGVQTGDAKWRHFREADVFCFPTFFESEGMPVVLIEALCFGLPIVTTRWRQIPAIVEDDKTALISEPHDSVQVASNLELLATHPEVRQRMSENARKRFLDHFLIDNFYRNLQVAFDAVSESAEV